MSESNLTASSCSITSDLDMSCGGGCGGSGSITIPATNSTLPDVDLTSWTAMESEKKYRAVYSVGIINILRNYGMGAKFSELFRSKFRRDSLIDAEPNIYADRLIKFASEAIVTKPQKKVKKVKKIKDKEKDKEKDKVKDPTVKKLKGK